MKNKPKVGHCLVVGGLLFVVLLSAGCRRKRSTNADVGNPPPASETATSTAVTPSATSATASAPASVAPASVAPQKPTATAIPHVVEELNYALQDYRERTGKMPKSVQELLTAAKLPPPRLPPGGQIRINEQFKAIEYVPPGGR